MKDHNTPGSKSCEYGSALGGESGECKNKKTKGSHEEARTRWAFDKLLTDQHIPLAIEKYGHAAYINVLVATMQGLQHTDCMQEERLSTQATHAVKLYITSNRDLEDLDTQALNELPVWTAASGFVKAVKKHPALSFEDHALFRHRCGH